MGPRIRLDHLNHVCFGRCGSSTNRVSATGTAQDNPAMTGFDFTNDLAELTLSKPLPYTPLSIFPVPNVNHYNSSFRIGRLYSCFKGDSGLTPNMAMSGAEARSAKAYAQLAG